VPGAPHQQPPRKRHRGLKITLGIIGGFVVLVFVLAGIGAALGGSSGSGTSAGSSTGTGTETGSGPAAQGAGSSAPGIGDKVRDGKFEFVVTKVSHRKSVGDTQFGLGETAQGTFTVISLKVTNIGSESQALALLGGPNPARWSKL
jgi:hypothetical protein